MLDMEVDFNDAITQVLLFILNVSKLLSKIAKKFEKIKGSLGSILKNQSI